MQVKYCLACLDMVAHASDNLSESVPAVEKPYTELLYRYPWNFQVLEGRLGISCEERWLEPRRCPGSGLCIILQPLHRDAPGGIMTRRTRFGRSS